MVLKGVTEAEVGATFVGSNQISEVRFRQQLEAIFPQLILGVGGPGTIHSSGMARVTAGAGELVKVLNVVSDGRDNGIVAWWNGDAGCPSYNVTSLIGSATTTGGLSSLLTSRAFEKR
jgi:hypothetical protein